MLTGMELNFESLEIQKWKPFFLFFTDDSKTLVTV